MIVERPLAGLGLAATLDDVADLCRRRVAGDETLAMVDFVNLGLNPSDRVPADVASLLEAAGWTAVIHAIDINLTTTVDLLSLERLRSAGEVLGAAWFEEDLGVWTWGQMSLGLHHLPPVLDAESVAQTAGNIVRCAGALGRPLLVENPPVYYADGPLDMWTYLAAVGDAADCGLVLDSGHMMGFHINTDSAITVAPPGWAGWGRVREIHVSGFQVVALRGRPVWIDRHSEPLTRAQLDWVGTALEHMGRRCAICLELDGASRDTVAASVAAARALLDAHE
ncbi:multinuclear nonheme iron-dependent oxidase [Sorangium sp. So ce887]|uniref:multinuclear nonheme iron-dependent oxidase n=1 Tax=Sorangium sp. So ce887 TaxID=3133324 RepID=UPI003F629D66